MKELAKKFKKEIILGESVVIKPGVHFEGHVIVGDNSVIGPNCYIRDFTSIGKNCKIGNGSEVKHSIIMDNSNVPHLNYVGDSVLGEHCNLGAGTKIANLRHDNQPIKVLVNGEVKDSGKRKLGVFLGDYTKTGITTSFYPGVIAGPFSWTLPNSTVNSNIEPFRLYGNSKQLIPKERISGVVEDKKKTIFIESLYDKLKGLNYKR